MLTLSMDPDVRAVASFMQQEVPAARLVAVARAVAELAPSLWGKHEPEGCEAIRLVAQPPSSSQTPSAASV